MTPESVPMQELLTHADFVRGLARDPVRDPDVGDDLAQEAWLRTLRSPPRHGESLRGWFATLLQNLWRNHLRGERRQQARVEALPPPAPADPAVEIVAREQVRQRLLAAVLQLDEPAAGATHGRPVAIGRESRVVVDNSSAGSHSISVSGVGVANASVEAAVVAGGEAAATIELQSAAVRETVIEYGVDQRVVHMRVEDAAGSAVFDQVIEGTPGRPLRRALALPLGSFVVRVRTAAGVETVERFTTTSLAPDPPPVVVRAK
jgi:hypothetical protein